MAKKAAKSRESSGGNKSQAIRDYLQQNSGAGPKAIAEALNSREGWDISAAYVSTIKNKMKSSGGFRRRGRAPKATGGGSGLDAKSLIQANELLKQAGSINQAKAALDLLAKLTS